ncbi:T-cell ecto-ADP-ribosyltransferase 2-like [Onychomys torridus]|uniref:T-cell ecto-ADP-ribosyltransferase 2-like n=1 Tax=Onychomys torridus TaxID=38674 RepID=UPI00167F54C1|nr:T-cell ecto-ADP-ribosyltransferase 2-like [Onychomys torridus]
MQGFELPHSNTDPIYNLLECGNELVLQNHGHMVYMTRGNSFCGDPVLMLLKLKMISLLDSKVHTLLLTWFFTQQVTGLTDPSNLDMAPNAFDDQYEGCVKDMERKAPQLLQEDFNMSRDLKPEWEKAEKRWKEIKNTMSNPKGFHDFHGTALVAYTGKIYEDFNRAVREFRGNPGNFHYKAFHYYLTRALQLLSNNNCHNVSRGTRNKFHYSGKGSVRFGQFASSSLEERVALYEFGGASGTLFTIKTCLGANISKFSHKPKQKEVLIPGYEVYSKVTQTSSGKGYDKISLDSPKREKSNFNCYYSGSTDNSHFSSSGESGSVVEVELVGTS